MRRGDRRREAGGRELGGGCPETPQRPGDRDAPVHRHEAPHRDHDNQSFVRDPNTGYLKAAETGKHDRADLATDLKVDMAIRRRGLVLEMADVTSWEKHERIREELLSAWARRQPPGYDPLSVSQVRKADEVAFTLLARVTSGGIKKIGGVRPMDEAVEDALKHRDFNLAFQPLPSHGEGSGTKRDLEDNTGSAHQKRRQRQAARQAETRAAAIAYMHDRHEQQGKAGGKGKKDGKGKGKARPSAFLPAGLQVEGAAAKDEHGTPICFNFNLDGCQGAQPGGKCPKGRHVCVLRKCQNAAHGYSATHGTLRVQ